MITASEKRELLEESVDVVNKHFWDLLTDVERWQMEQENNGIAKRWCRYE